MDTAAINAFRVELIAQHTSNAQTGVRANLVTAYRSLHRAVTAIDTLLDSTTQAEAACDLTHIRARMVTAGAIIKEELSDLVT